MYRVVVAALAVQALAASFTAAETGDAGDQLLFPFDGRGPRQTFLLVSNPSDQEVHIQVVLYPTNLIAPLGSFVESLPAFGVTLIDPVASSELGAGVAGLAVVTPIAAPGDERPVVPPAPLVGVLTQANTELDAAFGENPCARLAVTSEGLRAPPGSIVDGTQVAYQRLVPTTLIVPGFFDPASLGDPVLDGNRLVLVGFADQYLESGFALSPIDSQALVTIVDRDGTPHPPARTPLSGMVVTNLQEVAGNTDLSGSGKVFLEFDAGQGNVFGLFSMALGSFGLGVHLPSVGATDSAGDIGDQLLFPFDGRGPRQTFLLVSNPSDQEVHVQVVLYPTPLAEPAGSFVESLPAFGTVVIDPIASAQLTTDVAGLAVLTPVAAPTDERPIVPPEPLVGTFAQANVDLGAAFGEHPRGRLAVTVQGLRAPPGSIVDGVQVVYQRIAPTTLMIPGFFDPATLGDPSQDGNRLVLIGFVDQYRDTGFSLSPIDDQPLVTIVDRQGNPRPAERTRLSGMTLTNLQELAGDSSLAGSGTVFLDVDPGQGNILGLFSMALGNFGVGLYLPSVNASPPPLPATPPPEPTPASEPTPTPEPTLPMSQCGNDIVESPETCDGDTGALSSCRDDCTFCGDGNVDAQEECDEGTDKNGRCGECTLECTVPNISLPGPEPLCGNGELDCEETCDDGNQIDTDACRNSCTFCGDGQLQPESETCDDGNDDDLDGCRRNCSFCGDGIVDLPFESCDDGNQIDTDSCIDCSLANLPPPRPPKRPGRPDAPKIPIGIRR